MRCAPAQFVHHNVRFVGRSRGGSEFAALSLFGANAGRSSCPVICPATGCAARPYRWVMLCLIDGTLGAGVDYNCRNNPTELPRRRGPPSISRGSRRAERYARSAPRKSPGRRCTVSPAARSSSRQRAATAGANGEKAQGAAGETRRLGVEHRRRDAEDSYRAKWRWDSVGWGSHGLGCYPGNCPYRVYVRDGKVVFEEQAGTFPIIEPGVPDMNPTGCQKGCAWKEFLYGEERLLHPEAGRRARVA